MFSQIIDQKEHKNNWYKFEPATWCYKHHSSVQCALCALVCAIVCTCAHCVHLCVLCALVKVRGVNTRISDEDHSVMGI